MLSVRAVAKRRQRYMQARPLSAENSVIQSAETVPAVEGNMRRSDLVRTGGLCGVQEPSHACKHDTGTWEVFEPGCKGKEQAPTPMTHGLKKSDSAMAVTKPANNGVRASAEPVERRAGPKENSKRQSRRHAQEWARLSHAADQVRQAATPAVLQSTSNGGAACLSGHVRICAGGAQGNLRSYRNTPPTGCLSHSFGLPCRFGKTVPVQHSLFVPRVEWEESTM